MFVNGNEIFKFKIDNKDVKFPAKFCLGNISNKFSVTEPRDVSLNGNMYDISVDYNSIDKYDIWNTHKYLMNKSNIK